MKTKADALMSWVAHLDGEAQRNFKWRVDDALAEARAEGAAAERERIQQAVDRLPPATGEKMRKIGKAVMAGDVRRAILAESIDRGEA